MNLPTGRDLDALIAEKVFGLCPEIIKRIIADNVIRTESGPLWVIPHYSTNIADAWIIITERGLKIELQSPGAPCNDDEYENESDKWRLEARSWDWKEGDRGIHISDADSASHAICLAALKAVEEK